MGHCRDCKFWNADEDRRGWDWPADFNHCGGVKERWVITDTPSLRRAEEDGDSDAWVEARKAALVERRAFVEDASEYSASLVTHGSFGCVLFEPKPE